LEEVVLDFEFFFAFLELSEEDGEEKEDEDEEEYEACCDADCDGSGGGVGFEGAACFGVGNVSTRAFDTLVVLTYITVDGNTMFALSRDEDKST